MGSDNEKPRCIIDRSGRRVLPIGRDGFAMALEPNVLVDKTMLIADILDSGYAVTLFCRPRRFGKTLNTTMLRAFLDCVPDRAAAHPASYAALFEGTDIWDASDGACRRFFHRYPVVNLSLRLCTAI